MSWLYATTSSRQQPDGEESLPSSEIDLTALSANIEIPSASSDSVHAHGNQSGLSHFAKVASILPLQWSRRSISYLVTAGIFPVGSNFTMDCRLLRASAITLPRLMLATAIGLFGGNESLGELPEFRDVLMLGSISNPSGLAYWQFGDDDGDGIVDVGELEAPPVPIRSTLSTIASTYQNAPNGEFPDFYDFSSPESFSRLGSGLGASTYQSRPLFVQMGGVEVMQTIRFKTELAEEEREEGSQPIDSVDLALGARFFDFSSADPFMINGLGAMSVSTMVSNQMSGPQASVSWNRQVGRWRMTAANSLMLGYCDIEGSQSVNVASSIIPGRLNQPVLLRSSSASHSLEANDIAPLAELRLRASYDVASSTALFVGYDLLYLGALRTPIDSIIWSLPSMGLQDRGGDDLSVSTLSMGIEWTR